MADLEVSEDAEPVLRCPECDTYSGSFTEHDGWVNHSTCGREAPLASFIRGTQEYGDAFNEGYEHTGSKT